MIAYPFEQTLLPYISLSQYVPKFKLASEELCLILAANSFNAHTKYLNHQVEFINKLVTIESRRKVCWKGVTASCSVLLVCLYTSRYWRLVLSWTTIQVRVLRCRLHVLEISRLVHSVRRNFLSFFFLSSSLFYLGAPLLLLLLRIGVTIFEVLRNVVWLLWLSLGTPLLLLRWDVCCRVRRRW